MKTIKELMIENESAIRELEEQHDKRWVRFHCETNPFEEKMLTVWYIFADENNRTPGGYGYYVKAAVFGNNKHKFSDTSETYEFYCYGKQELRKASEAVLDKLGLDYNITEH